jgi:SPP1 family predicted phage head-tail adaptor
MDAPQAFNWPVLDPGRMVHRVDILRSAPGWDDSGPVVVWTPFLLNVWAAIEPQRTSDVVRTGQITTKLYTYVIIRYQAGINAADRVQSLKGTWTIQGVINTLERDIQLVLECLELGDTDTA